MFFPTHSKGETVSTHAGKIPWTSWTQLRAAPLWSQDSLSTQALARLPRLQSRPGSPPPPDSQQCSRWDCWDGWSECPHLDSRRGPKTTAVRGQSLLLGSLVLVQTCLLCHSSLTQHVSQQSPEPRMQAGVEPRQHQGKSKEQTTKTFSTGRLAPLDGVC